MKKSLIFKILYLFLVLIVVAGASVFATNTYLASQISYGNSNVEDALNGLFRLKENTYRYSTDEQIVGKWTNNKTIYRKIISTTTLNEINKWQDIADVSSLNIDKLVYINSNVTASHGWTHPITDLSDTGIGITPQKHISFYTTSILFTNINIDIILEYTKTTD